MTAFKPCAQVETKHRCDDIYGVEPALAQRLAKDIKFDLDISGSGTGAGNLSFSWSATNGGNIVNGGNSSSPLVNASGDYIVTVTNNINGCTGTDMTQVTTDYNPPVALTFNGPVQVTGAVLVPNPVAVPR